MSKITDLQKKYLDLCHAVQSATGYLIANAESNNDESLAGSSPKHIRTGLNLIMSDHSALVALLFEKKLITEEEYFEAIVAGTEWELERLTALANAKGDSIRITFS